MTRLSSLLLLVPLVAAHRDVFPRDGHHHHARQAPPAAPAPGSSVSASKPSSAAPVSAPTSISTPSGVVTGVPTTSGVLPDATLTATDPNIPPLSDLTSGAPSGTNTVPLPTVAQLGQPAPFPNFPPLPSTTLNQAEYPVPTGTIVAYNPDDVKEWLQELEGHNIPDIPPTVEGGCATNPQAAADTTRCWWTCGGCTRPSDVFTCPDKFTWGLTFDDGPSPHTPRLLEYLKDNSLKSTFAVVGGSNYYFSDTLRSEYVAGHHIIVHTYRHPAMTTLTTPEVVAELGYTRKIIKDTIGVTPAYWRPPYGDVDDRVRAIAAAMGMQTILWTRNPQTGEQFDTNDWHIPGGQSTGPQSFQQFQNILANASLLNTGFIVLQHDLYEQTVDLAVGYTLPAALAHNPKFTIKPVIDCINVQPADAYQETMQNKDRPMPQTNWTGGFIQNPAGLLDGVSGNGSSSSSGSASGGASGGSGKNAAATLAFSTLTLGSVVLASLLAGLL